MSYEKGAKDGKHYWLTPPDLMEKLDKEFHFDFDPCPYPKPDDFDGLEVEWGKSNYVNPPFNGPTKWVRKAIEEFKKGKQIVFVFPIDKWVHFFIEQGAEIRNLKDVKWHSIEENKPGKGTGRHIACFILDPKKQKEIRQEYDSAIKEKMIQQLWFKVKGLPGKNPKIELSVVEQIINEVKV